MLGVSTIVATPYDAGTPVPVFATENVVGLNTVIAAATALLYVVVLTPNPAIVTS